jgi:hypothetical protein
VLISGVSSSQSGESLNPEQVFQIYLKTEQFNVMNILKNKNTVRVNFEIKIVCVEEISSDSGLLSCFLFESTEFFVKTLHFFIDSMLFSNTYCSDFELFDFFWIVTCDNPIQITVRICCNLRAMLFYRKNESKNMIGFFICISIFYKHFSESLSVLIILSPSLSLLHDRISALV